jgi:AbrB family looped-hinge helix DNA binding protein
MEIAMDRAGRIVIPKELRDALGFKPGAPLAVTSDGVGIRIEPLAVGGVVVERDGRVVVESANGRVITEAEILEAIDAGRR